MTEDKNLFEKIKKVVEAHDTKFEAKAEEVAEDDAKLIDKIQLIIEKDEAFLEAAAEKIEAEEEAEAEVAAEAEIATESEEPATDDNIEEPDTELEPEQEPEPEETETEEAVEAETTEVEEATELEEPATDDNTEESDTELEVADEPEQEPEAPAEPEAETAEPEAPTEPEPLPVPPTGEHKEHWMSRVEDKFHALKPKTRVGKFFTKDRHNAMLCAMIALTIITGGWQLIDYLIPQQVTIKYATFAEAKDIKVSSRASTVEGAIKDSGIKVGKYDYVQPGKNHKIEDGDVIYVKKSVKKSAEIAGKEQDIYLIPGTVEDNLKFNEIKYDEDDQILPEKNAEVGEDTHIVVKEVHYTTEEKQEKVAAKSLVVLDPSLASGATSKTEGHDGEGIFTYKTTYINGVATDTSKEVKEWITEPVDNTFRLGTSETGHSGTYTIAQTFTANTTAYYMGEGARGAAGGRCVYGTCAVDPSVFPYGTMFFVEGYGVAIANDCGGAVKGHILDLWMHSYGESLQWGRRYVNAYVLK